MTRLIKTTHACTVFWNPIDVWQDSKLRRGRKYMVYSVEYNGREESWDFDTKEEQQSFYDQIVHYMEDLQKNRESKE